MSKFNIPRKPRPRQPENDRPTFEGIIRRRATLALDVMKDLQRVRAILEGRPLALEKFLQALNPREIVHDMKQTTPWSQATEISIHMMMSETHDAIKFLAGLVERCKLDQQILPPKDEAWLRKQLIGLEWGGEG